MRTIVMVVLATLIQFSAYAQEGNWVLVLRSHGQKKFSNQKAAIDWIEKHRAYKAVELRHGKVVRPCYTREDDGSSAHSRLVVCLTKEEFEKSFDHNIPNTPYYQW